MRPRRQAIRLKSTREIDLMRVAASTVSEILDELEAMVEPGVTTWDLDAAAEVACRRRGVTPAFKGLYGFPGSLCVAINDEVVHGIPSRKRALAAGDIIGLDFGVVYKGFYGDHARTVPVGQIDDASRRLIEVTRACLMKGIEQCTTAHRLWDIGRVIQSHAEEQGYSVVRDFVGHGIGRKLHEDPQVANYFDRGGRMPLKAGLVLCLEPMVNMGSYEVKVLDDDWTAVTFDGERSAHFEHTIAITEDGPEVLSVSGHAAQRREQEHEGPGFGEADL